MAAGAPVRVLLADDHTTVRQGLRLLIDSQPDMTVVGEAADGDAALRQASSLRPDLVVLDISMPGMNGLHAARALRQQQPDTAIIILTRHDDEAYLRELLRADVDGYVLKQSASTELLDAIRAVLAGATYLDRSMRAGRQLPSRFRLAGERPSPITDREAEVLRRLAWGYSNKEIATELDLSVKTVEVHKANASRKLGLRGRIDIVRYAILQGWLKDE